MTDRDGNRSNPYKPNPEKCCEACIFGSGEHVDWCERSPLTPAQREWLAGGSTFAERYAAARLRKRRPCVDIPDVKHA